MAGGHRTPLPPLFIHLLSHLALLVIPTPKPNQIYHTVRAASVLTLFPPCQSCLFFMWTFNLKGGSGGGDYTIFINVCLFVFFTVIFLFVQQISLKALSGENYPYWVKCFIVNPLNTWGSGPLITVLFFGRGHSFQRLFFFAVWQIEAAVFSEFCIVNMSALGWDKKKAGFLTV